MMVASSRSREDRRHFEWREGRAAAAAAAATDVQSRGDECAWLGILNCVEE